MKKLLLVLALVATGVGGAIYTITHKDQSLGASIPTVIAVYQDSIASRISNSATSFTLVRGTDKQSRALSGFYGFVLDEGTTSEEFLTANCVATACTIVTRGIDVQDGKTEVAGNKYEHRRGATVKITNYPQLAILSRILNGQESASSTLSFGGGTTADNKILFADNGTANKPFLKYAESSGLWTFSDNGTDEIVMSTQVSGGFSYLNIDQTRGLVATPGSPEKVGMRLSRDYAYSGEGKQGNVSFDANNAFTTFATSTVYGTFPEGGSPEYGVGAFDALVVTSTGSVLPSDTTGPNPYSIFKFVGFNASAGKASTQEVQIAGPGSTLCGWSGYGLPLTPASYYYLNGATGTIATKPGQQNNEALARIARVGFAISSDCLQVLQPKYTFVDEMSVSMGSPAGTTKFVTGFYPAHIKAYANFNQSGLTGKLGIHSSIGEIWTSNASFGNPYTMIFNTSSTASDAFGDWSHTLLYQVATTTDNSTRISGSVNAIDDNSFSIGTTNNPQAGYYVKFIVTSE
jgi:hypothetical protein